VDCYSCHKANADDPAAFDHYGQKIAVIVTPTVHNRAIAYRVARMDKAKPSPAALAAPSAPQMP
jgi:predicted metal-binding protein